MKKPVYILPNSFGPFEGPGVKYMVKKALSKCKMVTAREQRSVDAVKKDLNMNIALFPDLAFFLENGNVKREDLLKKFIIPGDIKIVAITMRPYRFPNSANPLEAYTVFKNEFRGFIEWLYQAGYMPLIIEHTFAITSHENDGDCIADVIDGLSADSYRLLSDRTMNCRELKSVYGCCDYIVGTRFHSLVFSLSNGVPGIAISYDGYKSIGIMRDMGLEEFVLDISDVRASTLEQKFETMVDNSRDIKRKISNYIYVANMERKELVSLMEIK